MKKIFYILLIALIFTILWISFLIMKPNFSEIQGIKSVKTKYDNYYLIKIQKGYMKKEKSI